MNCIYFLFTGCGFRRGGFCSLLGLTKFNFKSGTASQFSGRKGRGIYQKMTG